MRIFPILFAATALHSLSGCASSSDENTSSEACDSAAIPPDTEEVPPDTEEESADPCPLFDSQSGVIGPGCVTMGDAWLYNVEILPGTIRIPRAREASSAASNS